MARPTKTEATRQAQQTLDEACVHAAKLVRDVVRGRTEVNGKLVKMGRISGAKLVAAKIAIEQSLGLPKAKVYVKTNALSMLDIAELAESFDGNGDKDPGIINIPTKPLTARQLKERANYVTDN